MTQDEAPFPFKPRDWVARIGDHRETAQVKDVSRDPDGTVLLDLYLYDARGTRLGRVSPALGGPRTFEPCCDAQEWERIEEPIFPIPLKWIPNESGGKTARHVAGKVLPPANWVRKRRKPRKSITRDDDFRRALQAIADGHNDPRSLAKSVLENR